MGSKSREQKKKLLNMIISEILINDSLVEYLSKEEDVSVMSTPSSFILRNSGLNIVSLDIDILKIS